MTINEAFGQVVREEIEKRNMTKTLFSQETRITRQYIFRVFKGQHSPSLNTVLIIAKALDMDFMELMKKTRKLI